MKKIEILAPAGSYEKMKYAFAGGADAVYLSGHAYGARRFADNFSLEEIKEAVKEAHLRHKKVYVTVNTMLKEEELEKAISYCQDLSRAKVDAIIIQDLGLLKALGETGIETSLHASTQMTVHSHQGASLLHAYGLDRFVLPRETSLDDLKNFLDKSYEIELFVHGAHCMSYSGQCYMSSHIGPRSGNRGTCAQPCRKHYALYRDEEYLKEGHLLSPKDLSLLPRLEDIKHLGVDSLKIEGRMKSPAYAYLTAKAYQEGKLNQEDLMVLFSRGFTKGHFDQVKDQDFIEPSSPEHRGEPIGKVMSTDGEKMRFMAYKPVRKGDELKAFLHDKSVGGRVEVIYQEQGLEYLVNFKHVLERDSLLYRSYHKDLIKSIDQMVHQEEVHFPLLMNFEGQVGKQGVLTLQYGDHEQVVMTKEEVSPARNNPLDQEYLERQLGKLGDTVYQLQKLTTTLKGEGFLAAKEINDLRRRGVELLNQQRLTSYQPKTTGPISYGHHKPLEGGKLIVTVGSLDQLSYLVDKKCNADEIRYEGRLIQEALAILPTVTWVLPQISNHDLLLELETRLGQLNIQKVILHTFGQIALVRGKIPFGVGSTFNVANTHGLAFLQELGAISIAASKELTVEEHLPIVGTEVQLYGRNEVMIMSYCPAKGGVGHCLLCDQKKVYLKDDYGEEFLLQADYHCDVTRLLSGDPLDALKMKEKFTSHNIVLRFTRESPEEIDSVIEAYQEGRYVQGSQTKKFNFTRGVE